MLKENRYKRSHFEGKKPYHLSGQHPEDYSIFQIKICTFSNRYLWQFLTDIYKNGQELLSCLGNEEKIKTLKYLTPCWATAPPFYKKTYLGQLRTNLYTILRYKSPIYLICKGQFFLKYLTPSWGSPTSPYSKFIKICDISGH